VLLLPSQLAKIVFERDIGWRVNHYFWDLGEGNCLIQVIVLHLIDVRGVRLLEVAWSISVTSIVKELEYHSRLSPRVGDSP
jgi:hypothetical protein